MTTLAKLKDQAAKLNATVTVEREGLVKVCRCTAPMGYIWNTDVHEFVDEVYTGPNDYEDIIYRMSFGLSPCTDINCDWCCPTED